MLVCMCIERLVGDFSQVSLVCIQIGHSVGIAGSFMPMVVLAMVVAWLVLQT